MSISEISRDEHSGKLSFGFIVEKRPKTNFRRTGGGKLPREVRRFEDLVTLKCKQKKPSDWPKNGLYRLMIESRYPDLNVADVSNIRKVVEDALEGVGYENDRQIADIQDSRFVCPNRDTALITVFLELIDQPRRLFKP